MAWEKTGTATVTNGSKVVTINGGLLVTNSVQAGSAFIGPDKGTYEIQSVDANTQLTLTTTFTGGTGTGPYMIQPTMSVAADLLTSLQAIAASYQVVRDGIGQGMFPDGSTALPGFRFTADQDTGIVRGGANALGIVTGGSLKVTIANCLKAYSDASSYALDIVGNAQDASQIRWLNGSFSTVLGTLAFVPGFGSQLAAAAGGLRLAAAAGSGVYTRVGSVDITVTSAGAFAPVTDNGPALGNSGSRWAYVAAASSSIVTSDETTKTWRGALTADELAAARDIAASIGVYQLNDAIALKGAENARLHIGVRAQQVWRIMAEHGLIDPITPEVSNSRYAFLSFEQWGAIKATPDVPAVPATPEVRDEAGKIVKPADPGTPATAGTKARAAGSLYGMRPDELQYFLTAAQEQRLLDLEAGLTACINGVSALAAAGTGETQ